MIFFVSFSSLFDKFDTDKSNSISKSEMEQAIHSVKFGEIQLDRENVIEKVMKDLDKDGDDIIDEEEFFNGVTKWLNKAIDVTKCKDAKKSIDEFDKVSNSICLLHQFSSHLN